MKEEDMKKFTSILLILSILLASAVTGFADNTANENNNFNNDNINYYIDMYEAAATNVSIIEKNDDNATLNIVYDLVDETIYSVVNIESETDGAVKIVCEENGKTDILKITNTGTVFINDSEIIVEETGNPSDSNIQPFARRYNKLQKDCPYGSPSDYSVLRGDPIKQVIRLENEIQDITVSAFVGYIFSLMFPQASFTTAAIGTIATYVYSHIKNNDPSARAFSCITYQYIHKTKGELINGEHIFKNRIVYYLNPNYTTKIDEDIVYNIIKTG